VKVLFLNPPSFEGFDGGAGSRYQAKREIRSFWYPTWLAQPAALVPGSKLVDAPADDLTVEQVLELAPEYDMTVIHTSTPSLPNDAETARRFKEINPKMTIGFVGAQAAVLPEKTLQAAPSIDYVARKESDFTVKELSEGRPFNEVAGISYRLPDGRFRHNKERALIHDMDSLPHVVDVYKRDLIIENYYIGYLQHPYVSLYTGRGCTSKCTFCLWPQTIGGHVYRVRSPQSVYEEMKKAKEYFPQVKEFFFDDDTFTSDLGRAEEIARKLKTLGLTWSCNAKANVPYETLKVLKECGLRLLLVGFESGNQEILNNIKKGIRIDKAREFSQNCRKLGIRIHGTFILGLPGETRQTIEETIKYACEIDPHTLQVSLAAPYPGTELYKQAEDNGWFAPEHLVNTNGIQAATLSYGEECSADYIFESVERFYKKFYLRPRPIIRIMGDMIRDKQEMKRRLREGAEFFSFMNKRKEKVAQP
jgi:hopanoid biosynthesis associated radical SAM protein HpnJ